MEGMWPCLETVLPKSVGGMWHLVRTSELMADGGGSVCSAKGGPGD